MKGIHITMKTLMNRVVLLALISLVGLGLVHPATGASAPFSLGVASRATAHSVILWGHADHPGTYKYLVSRHGIFSQPVARGSIKALSSNDNTFKKVISGLDPGTRYSFEFFGDGGKSDVGSFRTLPLPNDPAAMKLAITGDSDELWTDWPAPQTTPFEVLDRVKEEHPDLLAYVGDTIYSDSETGAPLATTLAEKWAKYRNNRVSAARNVLRSVSTWAVLDDHEVVNDFDGAQLKIDNPSLFATGLRAFRDYWPIPGSGRMYRKVDFGKNIDLIFLDERSFRSQSADEDDSPCRDVNGKLDLAPTMPEDDRQDLNLDPVDPDCLAHVNDPDRTMLGQKQLGWFKKTLKNSDARWKLVINEVPISQIFAQPYDRWDGYPAERAKILSFIDNKDIKGVEFLTTDLHANIGGRVYLDITQDNQHPIAYEMVTGPIQTCTLDCEVDKLLNSAIAGEYLQNFLVTHGLTDTDCINIDTHAYGLVSTDEKAKKLTLEWKGNDHAPGGGGADILGCDDVHLSP